MKLGRTGLVVAALLPSIALTEPAARAQDAWTASATFENDLFVGTDKNYTNGVQLNFLSPDLTGYLDSGVLPGWAQPLIDALPFINEPGLQRNVGISLGQKIFTPENTRARNLVKDDRPYAGWLYLGTAFHNKNPNRLDSIELQIGMVGPAALGEEAQNNIHKVRGIDRAKGWDRQLDNEPGLVGYYERKWRAAKQVHEPSGLGFDIIPHLGAAVGNVATYASAGAEMRLGWHVPSDFGTSLIRPGGDTNAPADNSDPRVVGMQGLGVYLFSGFSGRVVARDIFLDGNTFTNSHEVDKKLLVGDAFFGVSTLVGGMKVSYAQVFRTREFDGQDSASSFGSVTLSYTYSD